MDNEIEEIYLVEQLNDLQLISLIQLLLKIEIILDEELLSILELEMQEIQKNSEYFLINEQVNIIAVIVKIVLI
jgi:hypothetical protein